MIELMYLLPFGAPTACTIGSTNCVPQSPALRRQGMEALSLGDRETAVALCRQASAADASAENLTALAAALATPRPEGPVSDAEAQEALSLARRAVALAPDDFYAQQSLAQAGIASDDSRVIEQAADQMVRIAPEEMAGYYYRFLVQAAEGDYDAAEASLLASFSGSA